MAYVMFQYDRPTESHRWNDYNQHVRDWIAQLLQIPGAVSFMAYRTTDGASPNTITMLDFGTLEEARRAASRINSPWCAPACSSAFACRWVKGGWHALADAGSGPAV